MARGRLRSNKRRSSAAKKKGGIVLSLRATSLISISTFTFIFLVGIFWSQLYPLLTLQTIHGVQLTAKSERLANSLSLNVATYKEAARAIATDPKTQKLITSGSRAEIAARERELRVLFPWVMRIRLLPGIVTKPNKSSEPHIGFACIDMMREAATNRVAPPVEVHLFGTPQQHIDIVQPILSAAGTRVIGILQVTMKTDVLKQWLSAVHEEGYISLTQKIKDRNDLLVADFGDSAGLGSTRTIASHVPGTNWDLNLWLKDSSDIGIFNANFLITFIVGALMIFLLGLLLWRALSRAISLDVDAFMHMVAAHLYGKKDHKYTLLLPEFQTGARQISTLSPQRTMERERDSDTSSLTLENLDISDDIGTPFRDDSSVAVEELDDAAIEAYQKAQAAQQQTAKTQIQPEAAEPEPEPHTPPPAKPPAEIFKAYDIRGIVGKTLTAQHMQLIGRAIGSEAAMRGLHRISFARDGRLSGAELGQALVKGLMASGLEVIDVGMVPTPVLYYAAHELTDGTGVMLTGSHNPSDYNGVKMVLGGETLAGETIQALKQRIDTNDFVDGKGQYKTQPQSANYIERILSDVSLPRPLKIVVDSGNGVAGALAPKLFTSLGCEVIELYSEIDGNFPNHHPDPSQPENLADLIDMVQASNADIGFAFDGDGDRLGVVSSSGEIIWPDRLMMLFAADVLKRNPGAQIIYDIKCSNNLTKVIWEKGGEPMMWKTGHSLIKAKMKQSGALLAGEMSGHIFFQERWYGFDDALYAGARLLEIIAADERTPIEIFASLPNAVNTPELRVNMPQNELDQFMEELLVKVDFPDANLTMIDGIRADFEYGWGLMRASNTTPSLIMRFEGKDKESLEMIQEKFKQVMLDIQPNLPLPF